MRRLFATFAAVLAVAFALPANAAQAYPWNIPANVRIVQKDTPDNVRTFTSIQAAVNSITDASATNPYVVRIMPGTYLEAVTMKDSISLVGSGPESTVIEGPAGRAAVSGSSVSFTVADLRIVQRYADTAGISAGNGLKVVTLRNVVVEMLESTGWAAVVGDSSDLRISDSRIVSTRGGHLVRAYGGPVLLERSVVESTGQVGDHFPVGVAAADVTMRESRIVLTSPWEGYGVMAEGGVATVVNSEIVISVVDDGVGTYGVSADGPSAVIRNSRISVSAATPSGVGDRNAAISGGGACTVDGSVLEATSYVFDPLSRGNRTVSNSTISAGVALAGTSDVSVRVGGSKIVGSRQPFAGNDKIVNCYDGNFEPIPNF